MKIYFYKIYCLTDETIFYIGSTNNLSRRKSHHKKNVKNKVGKLYWTSLYKFIRENGGWENFNMIAIKIDDYENKNLWLEEEQNIIEELRPPLNTIKAKKK